MLKNEIESHFLLNDNDGVVNLRAIHMNSQNLYLALSIQSKGSLATYLKQEHENISEIFSEGQCKIIMMQLLLTLDYIHRVRCLHRDLKIQNIMVDKIENGHFKVRIADFGLSVKSKGSGFFI